MARGYNGEVEHMPQYKDASAMIVCFSLDVSVRQQENRQNYSDDIPSREDETGGISAIVPTN